MSRHVARKHLLLTLDAFGTLFAPKEPIAKQYGDVARALGLATIRDNDVQTSFRKGMPGLRAVTARVVSAVHCIDSQAAFKDESKRHPNYGKAVGLEAKEWWANVGLSLIVINHPSHID